MAVERIVIKCNICGTHTLLRVQIGHIERMPIAIGCIGCGVVLKGYHHTDNSKKQTSLELLNGTVIQEETGVNSSQEIECSAEFPTRRFTKGAGEFRVSPFINAFQTMKEESYIEFVGRINSFVKEWKTNGSKLHDVFKLYKNQNYLFMNKLLLEITTGKIPSDENNKENFFYYVIVKDFMTWIYPENNKKLLKPIDLILEEFISNKTQALNTLEAINNKMSIQEQLNRGLELYFRFLDKFSSFTPAMCILFSLHDGKEYLGGDYIITSFDFEENKGFFVDSYEWLSRNLYFFVSICNALENSDFTLMKKTKATQRLKVNSIDDFMKMDHGKKKEITEESIFLSSIHEKFWNNGQLRNAIQHYKHEFNPVTQQIKYFPYSDPKKASVFKEISLIKFAYLSYISMQAVHQGIYFLFNLATISKRA